MTDAVSLATNYHKFIKTIPDNVTPIFVTKYVDISVTEALIKLGAQTIGENRIQVAREKQDAIKDPIAWHMIGPLQKNKAKYAVRMFELIQSVDSLSLAIEINKQAKKISKTQKILIQINIGKESQKHGFLPEEIESATKEISELSNIEINGLMAIPPFSDNPENTRGYFREMKTLFDKITLNSKLLTFSYLSMGMSGDYLIAIEEGANMVRVGSLLFQ